MRDLAAKHKRRRFDMDEKKEYIVPECEIFLFGAVDTVNDDSEWSEIIMPE